MIDELSQILAAAAQAPQQTLGRVRDPRASWQRWHGEVYRARDLTLDRLVALKFLPSHLAADPEAG